MADTAQSIDVEVPDPWSLPLEGFDVSKAEIFQQNKQGEYFRRLRKEAPVHYCPESAVGAYWSVTKYNDIIAVDSNHKVFSSVPSIVIGDPSDDFQPPMFIAMDPPIHDIQRKAAQPAVAPSQLSELEDLIRQRVCNILDSLPVGEEFNWVDRVSIELTTQMLATLFDYPFEDRHKLPFWSDVATTSDAVGVAGVDMEWRMKHLNECLASFTELWHQRAAEPRKFDFISLLAHDPQTKDMVNNPSRTARQPDAADRGRKRHDPQLDLRRRLLPQQVSGPVRQAESGPFADPEHGLRDYPLPDTAGPYAAGRDRRYGTWRAKDTQGRQGRDVVRIRQPR
jgi:cytochrome P450